jgi:poly-gamma-glutamate synthesis protein (capsule biosynthesis protein)
MGKIEHKWYWYWLGCAVGGIILGLVISYLLPSSQDTLTSYQSGPLPTPLQSSSVPTGKAMTTLLFTGDVMLGRSVGYRIDMHKDPMWPFIYVSDVMRSADITYINLETPLTVDCPLTQTGMKFCSEVTNVAGLTGSGVDIASVANNHTTNYGQGGLSSTVSTLKSNGIEPVGQGDPVKLSRDGQVFTFLSLNDIGPYPGIDNVNPKTLSEKVGRAKASGEVLIVTFHWGHEYQSTPSARQVSLAHQVIDAGADVVIGAHPHWVQTKEIYKDKLIYYSLGNFVFDQEWSPETKRGLAVRLTYDGHDLVKTEELPVLIREYGQPHWQ